MTYNSNDTSIPEELKGPGWETCIDKPASEKLLRMLGMTYQRNYKPIPNELLELQSGIPEELN